jgi:hypothetical protein
MRQTTLVVMLAACNGGASSNIQPTLSFADRSDAEIARLVSAAGGTDMFSAQAQLDSFADSTDPCPAVAIAGDTVTLTGGCTTQDMVALSGTATATNPIAWDPQVPYQYGSDTAYALHQFAFAQSSFSTTYDGTFRISDNFTTWQADLTVDMLGLPVHSQIYYSCDQGSQSCDLVGSGLELVGVGGAQLSGSVYVSTNTADFTLEGVDTLTVHLAQGCVAWSISGTQRQKLCP